MPSVEGGDSATFVVRGLWEVQVSLVEVADFLQTAPIRDGDVAQGPRNQASCLQVHQRAVDVDAGEAGGIRKLLLRPRELIAGPISQTDGFKPDSKFAKEMRDPRRSIAPCDVQNPFAKDRAVD